MHKKGRASLLSLTGEGSTFFLETALFPFFLSIVVEQNWLAGGSGKRGQRKSFLKGKGAFWISRRAAVPLVDLLALLSLEPCSFIVLQEIHCLY